jgi:hypothetical protein
MDIVEQLGRLQAFEYWPWKIPISLMAYADWVAWNTLQDALQSLPPLYQMCLSKFALGHSAVGSHVFAWSHKVALG